DFGSGPNILTFNGSSGSQKLIGIGQKSGVYWAVNPATGAVVWSTLVGPGTSLGGIMWGSAFDGQQIYVPDADSFGVPWTLIDGTHVSNGAWSALNPSTGKI